jgi:RNA polymerase sigma-70 factor (ECF subfamily)
VDSRYHKPASPPAIVDEEKLIGRAQAGDPEAFSDLYRTYVQAIHRYLLLRVSGSAVAEDLTAEVFLRAVDSLPRYSHRGLPFGAWLFRIARDRLVDYYRQSARQPIAELSESLSSDMPEPDARAEDAEQSAALYAALEQLTDDQRDVIQFRFMEDWSLEQTAQAMNKSVNAVKALQHRALNALNRILKDEKTKDVTE